MGFVKSAVKRILFHKGERLYTIRGGALKGRRFSLDLHLDTQVWRGIYEEALQQWLLKHVQPGSVCFDVGAAEGWATLLMALLSSQAGIVHAFEPSRRGDAIDKNLAANNDVPLAQVNVERVFVGACSTSTIERVVVSVDDYCSSNGVQRLDVLKIDVDGPELEVLEGARSSISRFRPAICVEAHSHSLCAEVINFLHENGYTTRTAEPPPHEHRPLEYNPMVFGTPSLRAH
jgi:cbb3-type cytochrome oxidase subunit 3